MNLGVERANARRAGFWLFLMGLPFLMLSCEKDPSGEMPLVETTGISDIGLSSLTALGTLVQTGDGGVSEHGFCWSEETAPVMEGDSCILLGPLLQVSDFSTSIQGLNQNTSYHIRAFAVNGAGTAYGKDIMVLTRREPTVPTVETYNINSVTEFSAFAGGVVRDDGGSEISSYGICWDTQPDPDIEGKHLSFSGATGPYNTTIKNLDLNTLYYVRAFAINETGLAYGNEVEFRTNHNPVSDIDGNVYPTVQIGEQIWMTKNLAVSRYADGTLVPHTPEVEWWDSLKVDEKGWCYYMNNPGNRDSYGALYTWSAAVNGQDNIDPELEPIQGVCPAGWHLPSDAEWKELEIYLGMPAFTADSSGWRGNIAGKLKSTGRDYWLIPNEGATNETRFSALPAGDRFPKGEFYNLHYTTLYWTSSNYDRETAWARGLGYYVTTMYRGHEDSKEFGFSVRCVKDE